jgi:hypothetical protein
MIMDERTYTLEQWEAKGKELFGDDYYQWKFICPICKNVAAVKDFAEYKNLGATPNSAYQECIGRYTGGRQGPFKCDWCAYGLFPGPVTILDGEKKINAFHFDENKKE